MAVTDNYLCARYKKLSGTSNNPNIILGVGIRRVYTSSIEIFVLGYGSPIKAKFNGEQISSDLISKRRTLKCDGVNVGQMRVYDLGSFGKDKSGIFKLQSADKEASTFVEIN